MPVTEFVPQRVHVSSVEHTSSEPRNSSWIESPGSRQLGNDSNTVSTIRDEPERGHWGSKAEFILSCVGYSVGIGNVWRFPFLAYENGGGAFLIPYIILLVLIGKPMYYMECALGQYSQLGPVSVWKLAPIAKGVGYAMAVISLIVSIYYNVIMGYTLYYMFASWTSQIPWEVCDPAWAINETCIERKPGFTPPLPHCKKLDSQNITNYIIGSDCTNITYQTSVEQYWERAVLNISSSIGEFGEIGEIKWDIALCLLLSWTIVFLCLCKGVKSSGKVVYFTATFPYLILIILLVRGVTLEGAENGIIYFFTPTWDKLMEIQVWRAAAGQMFFSLGTAWGGLIMFGSYNKFNNNVYLDAMFVSTLDFLTSVIAGVVIFSVLGALQHDLSLDDIQDVAKGGQGLAFVAYPEALSRLPYPQFWATIFFFMLFTLGLDSEFALLETVLTAFYDEVPVLRKHKTKFTGFMCAVCFLLGIPLVSSSGQYILDLMDTYGGGIGVLIIAIFELAALHWVYGVNNFSNNLQKMLGHYPGIYWRFCWSFISPVLLSAILIYALILWTNPAYPMWAQGVGWLLAAASVLQIPLWAIIMTFFYACKGDVGGVLAPTSSWGPGIGAPTANSVELLITSPTNQQIVDMYETRDSPGLISDTATSRF